MPGALTLTGLRPDDDDATVANANLDTHAQDVVSFLDRAQITDATLVGHSYGGMVIAAAADRAGGRVSRLVHLDAYVPRNGESCWLLTTESYRQSFVDGAADTGYAVRPPFRAPHGGDPRRRRHPLALSCKRSGSPASSTACPGAISFTAQDGKPRRPSPDSAPGSKPIRAGASMTSLPPTTRCVTPRAPSPRY